MRSKTPLTLMEQLVMLLVFALAAGLCLQVFVYAHQTSRHHEIRDRAVLEAQNAAEMLKSGGEEYFARLGAETAPGGGYILRYDENWQITRQEEAYSLTVDFTESGLATLWTAEITVRLAEGDEVFRLPVAGQAKEVAGGG